MKLKKNITRNIFVVILFSSTPVFFNNCTGEGDFEAASGLSTNVEASDIQSEQEDTTHSEDPEISIINERTCPSSQASDNIVEINTALPGAEFQRMMYKPANGHSIFAFKIEVPPNAAPSVKVLSATKTTSTENGKKIVISLCRGDYSHIEKDAGCYAVGTEVSVVRYAINYSPSEAPPHRYCHLVPGKTYWVNVASRYSEEYEPNCTSPNGCSFYFESN